MPLTATARAVAREVGGRTVLTLLRSQVPLSLRETADGLTVVASAFTPLGGDRTRLEVALGTGTCLRVGSAAAQVAQPGVHDPVSHAVVDLDVAAGARLHWALQPVVVGDGAEHRAELCLRVAATSRAVVVETVVLGRAHERPGRYRSRWRVRCDGEPLLSSDLDVGTGAADGWDGPAVAADARVLMTALVTGPDLPAGESPHHGGAVLRLAGPAVLFSWLGPDTIAAGRALDAFLATVPEPAAQRMPVRATPSTK